MSQDQLKCPKCGSERIVKNGFIHNGNQNHKCRNCKAPICDKPPQCPVTEENKKLIDRLLLERLSIAAICRVSGISETWMSPLRVAENTAPYLSKLQLARKKRTVDNFLVMKCGPL